MEDRHLFLQYHSERSGSSYTTLFTADEDSRRKTALPPSLSTYRSSSLRSTTCTSWLANDRDFERTYASNQYSDNKNSTYQPYDVSTSLVGINRGAYVQLVVILRL